MTLKSVVLPAPFGPMMPSRSPARTSNETSRTAVSPPKRLVTRSSVSTGPPRPQAGDDAGEALGHEAHDEDQRDAVDDQVDAGEARLHPGDRGAQVRLERRDQERAQVRAERRSHPADDRVQREADREVHREDVERVDEADVLRPERAADRGERGARRHGDDLQAPARDAEGLGRVLVLAHARELVADPRPLEVDLDPVEEERHDERQVGPRDVAEAEGREARAEGHRDAFGAGGEAAPAAGDDEQHLREGDRREREVGAPEPVRQVADDEAGADRHDHPDEHPDPRRLAVARGQERGRVRADPEERRVAERDLPRIASRHVPRGGESAPQEDEDQAVEEELIANDERDGGGDGEEREGARARAEEGGHHAPSVSAPRWPKSPAGRKASTAMKRTK